VWTRRLGEELNANNECVSLGEFNGRTLYIGVILDYTLRLWPPTYALRAISAVAELLVTYLNDYKRQFYPNQTKIKSRRDQDHSRKTKTKTFFC